MNISLRTERRSAAAAAAEAGRRHAPRGIHACPLRVVLGTALPAGAL